MSSRSAPGLQTYRDKRSSASARTLTKADIDSKTQALELQKSRLYQELYQMEDQHRKKNSIQARVASIQQHVSKLKDMSTKAKAMLARETGLLDRLNRELSAPQTPTHLPLDQTDRDHFPVATRSLLLTGDVSGVLSLLEFSTQVTAHLNFRGQRCSATLPFPVHRMSPKDLALKVVPHLYLKSGKGKLELAYDQVYPLGHITIAVTLTGYPHSVVCLDLSEAEDEVTILGRDEDIKLALTIPAVKLNLISRLETLDSAARMRLQQSLQANLLVQQKGGMFTLMYKSYTYHLGRLVYRVLPKHGELFSIKIHGGRTQFRDSGNEKLVCTAHLQVKDEEAIVNLVVDVLSNSLRLHFRWKKEEFLYKEESDWELFAFLTNLQFVSAKDCPVTFLKSLEMLKSIKPRNQPPQSPR